MMFVSYIILEQNSMSLGLSLNKKHIVFSVRYCKVVNCSVQYILQSPSIQYTQRMGFNLLNPIQIQQVLGRGFGQDLNSIYQVILQLILLYIAVEAEVARVQSNKNNRNPLNSHKLLFCFCILPPRKSMKILVLWQQSKYVKYRQKQSNCIKI